MVITGRAHCYTLCIFRSLLMQFEHSLGLGGESLLDVHYLHYALLTARSLSTLVTLQCNPHNVFKKNKTKKTNKKTKKTTKKNKQKNRTSCAQVQELP